MKREFLKGLNIEDALIDKILDEHSRGIGSEKARTDAATAAKTELENQLAQHTQSLADLKKSAEGNEALTKQLNELQEANKTAKTTYEDRIKSVQMNAAIKLALAGKVHDANIVSGLIDTSKIELDDAGNVKKGLESQIESLQNDKSFLFVGDKSAQAQPPQRAAGWKPAESSYIPKPEDRTEYEAKYANAKSLVERISIKQEAADKGVFLS